MCLHQYPAPPGGKTKGNRKERETEGKEETKDEARQEIRVRCMEREDEGG